jgi:hypothetical protein
MFISNGKFMVGVEGQSSSLGVCRGATKFLLAPTLCNLCISTVQITVGARLAVFAHDNCMHGTSRKGYVLSCKSVWHGGYWNIGTAQQDSSHHNYLHIPHAYTRIVFIWLHDKISWASGWTIQRCGAHSPSSAYLGRSGWWHFPEPRLGCTSVLI